MRQDLVVLGDPIPCGELDCREPAAVMIRQKDRDGTFSIIQYCDSCWLIVRRGYAPLVARDAADAIRAAEVLLANDDDAGHEVRSH